MSMKILSPAGDFESLKMAIYNGADEVYLGVREFNARNNIVGFSLAELKDAVSFAHIYDVKVHLTVNILFSDDELQHALDLIVDAYNLGVDAFIIQDLGLASIVHEHYPEIEMHASTQMGIHNLEGVRVAERLGFKRVVLARETPLDEISRIRENSDIEIEYFVQGALCVSFSGNCYFSSYEHSASGNRGKCKQLCRLPYTLLKDDREVKSGYLLSAKDFNMLDRLPDLESAGVTAIKIEGRARRPYYVAEATRTYAKAIKNESYMNNLPLAFNRGFTEGYFNGNSEIISLYQSHVGSEIGRVEKFVQGKRFNEIFISSDRELNKKSAFKFFRKGEEIETISAYDLIKAGRLYRITTTKQVKVGDSVNLISDFDLESEMLNHVTKRSIDIKITAKINEPICAKFETGDRQYKVTGDICQLAKSSPLTENEILDNFKKTEFFEPNISLELEKVFLTKKMLNEFRRKVYDKLVEVLSKCKHKKLEKIEIEKKKLNIFLNFQQIEQKNENLIEKHIIYSPEIYELEDIIEFIKLCKNNDKIPFLDLPNFALKNDIELIRDIVKITKIGVVVNNLWALDLKVEKVAGFGLNVYNSFSADYLNMPCMVAEGEYQNIIAPVMTLRHCPMKEHLEANCAECPYSKEYRYRMQNGKEFKLKRKRLSTCTFYLTD